MVTPDTISVRGNCFEIKFLAAQQHSIADILDAEKGMLISRGKSKCSNKQPV